MAQAAFHIYVEDGIIIRARSGWCSPLHFVLKPDKSWRPVGNYRQLNAVAEKDVYPLPLIHNFTAEMPEKRILYPKNAFGKYQSILQMCLTQQRSLLHRFFPFLMDELRPNWRKMNIWEIKPKTWASYSMFNHHKSSVYEFHSTERIACINFLELGAF